MEHAYEVIDGRGVGRFWAENLVYDVKLGTMARAVYLYLCRRADKERNVIYRSSVSDIADSCEMSDRAVHKAIYDLKNFGLLKLEIQGGGRVANRYTVLAVAAAIEAGKLAVRRGARGAPPKEGPLPDVHGSGEPGSGQGCTSFTPAMHQVHKKELDRGIHVEESGEERAAHDAAPGPTSSSNGSGVHDVLDRYHDRFVALALRDTGREQKPLITRKDAGIASQLIKRLGAEKTLELVDRMFESSDPWYDKAGRTMEQLARTANKLLGEPRGLKLVSHRTLRNMQAAKDLLGES